MEKVFIASSRLIGTRCREWALKNMPEGFQLVQSEVECDIFISVMYDQLLSEAFIASKKACFNFHPGILPQYRGSGAFSWAILNGDHHFGVTLHALDKSIDHVRILAKISAPVDRYATAEDLYNLGMEMIFKLFTDHFHDLLAGTDRYKLEEQDESLAKIYYKKDLARAQDLTRFVRAFTFTGKPNAYYYDHTGRKIELLY